MSTLEISKFYSLAASNLLTHIHVGIGLSTRYAHGNEVERIDGARQDLLSPMDALQLAVISMKEKETFIPHLHEEFNLEAQKRRTQETWVVIKGSVMASLYDLDARLLRTIDLLEGDALITVNGGHNYECLSKNSIIYEFKSGPYYPALDKRRF